MMSSTPLSGKLALVTGGSGTIGLAITKALVSKGATVVMTSRRRDRLEEAAKQFSSAHVHTVPSDVSNEESVLKLFEKVDEINDKRIDILVNNAGTNVDGASVDLKGSDFEQVLQVNVVGPFLCAREAMKRMRKAGGGSIINIGSLSAISPRPHSAPYTASKFALLGLTKSLALDGRDQNISVGIIHPGNVRSELLTPEMVQARAVEGFLKPEHVADCVVSMATLPLSANVLEMTVLPTKQPFVGRG